VGLDDGDGQIPGWGAVPAAAARAAALATGSIWTRVLTDPLTGRAIEASTTTYHVPASMATQIRTRDRTCRAPGCQIPATGTDLDHTTEWAPHPGGGPTAETNLVALHRGLIRAPHSGQERRQGRPHQNPHSRQASSPDHNRNRRSLHSVAKPNSNPHRNPPKKSRLAGHHGSPAHHRSEPALRRVRRDSR
jgi:hypothetical protein